MESSPSLTSTRSVRYQLPEMESLTESLLDDATSSKPLSRSHSISVPIVPAGRMFSTKSSMHLEFDAAAQTSLCILPAEKWYQFWFIITVIASAFTAWDETYHLAFLDNVGDRLCVEPLAMLHQLVTLLFIADIFIKFRVAVTDADDNLVTDPAQIRKNYFSGMFWVDLLCVVPIDVFVLLLTGQLGHNGIETHYIGLLGLLRVVRMYRVFVFFHYLDTNLAVGHLQLTLIRNFLYVFFAMHWAACLFYFLARQQHFSMHTWVGSNPELFEGKDTLGRYMVSLYWSVVTFATVGYGDVHAYTTAEATFVTVYISFNVALGAYIIGTTTMLVVRYDEDTRAFRDKMKSLFEYARHNDLPAVLRDDIGNYMEVELKYKDVNDEHVIGQLPTTMRRRILRCLYQDQVRNCYLFDGCKQKFIDAFLSAARVEFFKPQDEIISEDDYVNELFVVVAGVVELEYGRLSWGAEDLVMTNDDRSVHGGRRKLLVVGDTFGELAFFTEMQNKEAARSKGCKVMVVNRMAYDMLENNYPLAAKTILLNLLHRCEHAQQQVEKVRQRLASGGHARTSSDTSLPRSDSLQYFKLDEAEREVTILHNMVERQVAKANEMRVNSFLTAAALGDCQTLEKMLLQGQAVDCQDYDKRTALMLAAAKGHEHTVQLLLANGANPSATDAHSSSPLWESCMQGHSDIMQLLLLHGARLQVDDLKMSARLCKAVSNGDAPLLERILTVGANPDAADYDKRTALHIAAADGNLVAARIMVDVGKASLDVQDRWGNTPLDEALRVGSFKVVAFLQERLQPAAVEAALKKRAAQRTLKLLSACSEADTQLVKQMLQRDCPVDSAADYDGRTGLMVACAAGHLDAVMLLLEAGANPSLKDRIGSSPLLEACNNGHRQIVKALRTRNGQLGLSPQEAATQMCRCVASGKLQLLELLLMAGAAADSADYDQRTPLHLAAALNNLPAAKLLLEFGKGSPAVTDSWGHTPLDEAFRTHAVAVADYLKSLP